MTISAKFESTCPACRQLIAIGARVNWERGGKATHVECPKSAVLVGAILGQPAEQQAANISAMCDAVNGTADLGEGRAVLVEALELVEAQLWREFERQAPQAPPTEQDAQRLAGLARLQKGIYRVSLTGSERRYGVDHVNLQLTPSPKFGTVKVTEYQRDSMGRINRDGTFAFWPNYTDRTGVRTLAMLAAVDVLLGSADPIEFARAYAVAASSCYRCGADLVDEKSRERLLGPECYRQVSKGN